VVKIIVNKKALRAGIKLLSSSTKQQPGVITSSILFQVSENTLTLKASDNFVYTNLVLGPENGLEKCEGEGSFTVEFKNLNKWISNVVDDNVEIETQDDSLEVLFKCGSFESPFMSKDPNNFPSKAFDSARADVSHLTELPNGKLIESLSFVRDFISPTITTTDPTGNFTIAEVRNDNVVATDTITLAYYKHPSLNVPFTIGYDQVTSLLAYLKQQNQDSVVKYSETESFVFLEAEDSSYFGFTKPRQSLPSMDNIPFGLIEDEVFEIETDFLKQAIGALLATANSDDPVVFLTLGGEGGNSSLQLKMKTSAGKNHATVALDCARLKQSSPVLEFAAPHDRILKALASYGDVVKVAFQAGSYLKFYEDTSDGAVKTCLLTVRPESYM
jgi:hypothetical protein